MFNPGSEQHIGDCTCVSQTSPSNADPDEEEIVPTCEGLGYRMRENQEKVRLSQELARQLWSRGLRGRCLYYNVLAMFEPPSWEPTYNIWLEVRNNI